jgi:hypothetical protein
MIRKSRKLPSKVKRKRRKVTLKRRTKRKLTSKRTATPKPPRQNRGYIVKRAVSGGQIESHGPFYDLAEAIAKGCELLKAYPIAIVSIDDDDQPRNLIISGDALRDMCEQRSPASQSR